MTFDEAPHKDSGKAGRLGCWDKIGPLSYDTDVCTMRPNTIMECDYSCMYLPKAPLWTMYSFTHSCPYMHGYFLFKRIGNWTQRRHLKAFSMLQFHDDVIKWKHFPRYWPFVRGIHRSPVNSPHKSQWRGALMFTLICARINGWVNNREAGDFRRYRAHYDVIVMLNDIGLIIFLNAPSF